MRTVRPSSFHLAGIVILLIGLGFVGTPARVNAQTCTPAWNVVSSPNGSRENNYLGDVAVVSANDIWAVGNTASSTGASRRTLIEHWTGSSWSVVTSPNGAFAVNFLTSVSAVSSADVWAVGFTWNNSVSNSQSRTLIQHWNGTSWSSITSPNTTRPENRLHGVVAVSANDVWAVGTSFDFSVYRTLIMHWDGVSWSIVTSPNPGSSFDILYGIDAVAANDVWAVGTQQDFLEQTLVLHWDGVSWTEVASPQIGPYGNNMLRVFAVSASDIWAVGYHLTVFGFSQPYQTSAFHYDGTSWSAVTTPNVNQLNNYLFDVVGLAANDAWAVGFFDTGTTLNTMIQHWDGASWTIVSSPNPATYINELFGVAAVSASDVWAVGDSTDGLIGVNTMVQHLSGACPSTMHVAGITPSFRVRSGSFNVRATITIRDANGLAVSGASVTVTITRPDGSQLVQTRTTNASGQANASTTSTLTGVYTFSVTNVTKTGVTYDPSANVETSDSITVQ